MEKDHIKLTGSEAATLAQIDLREIHRNHDEGHAAYKANAQPILALLQSLSERSAVPTERLNYGMTHVIIRAESKLRARAYSNGTAAKTPISTHIPIFIRHLRYFLFGAELPDEVIMAFEEKVGNPQWVSSSDIVPIGKFARDLTRQYRLEKADAPEEFFKLCLDMGLSLTTAESVMRSVKQIRS